LWVQGRFSNPNLDPKVAESLFREHLVQLQKRAVDGFIELLEEVHRAFIALLGILLWSIACTAVQQI
jgi:hypothetical protein